MFSVYLFDRLPEGGWSPEADPDVFQVAFKSAQSGSVPRLSICGNECDLFQEMVAFMKQAEESGLKPYFVTMDSSSKFSNTWRDNDVFESTRMFYLDIAPSALWDMVYSPEREWNARHLAALGRTPSVEVKPLSTLDGLDLDQLRKYGRAVRNWYARRVGDHERESKDYGPLFASGKIFASEDWIWSHPSPEGPFLVHRVCPLIMLAVQREDGKVRLSADGLLDTIPGIVGLVPAPTTECSTEVDADTFQKWLDGRTDGDFWS